MFNYGTLQGSDLFLKSSMCHNIFTCNSILPRNRPNLLYISESNSSAALHECIEASLRHLRASSLPSLYLTMLVFVASQVASSALHVRLSVKEYKFISVPYNRMVRMLQYGNIASFPSFPRLVQVQISLQQLIRYKSVISSLVSIIR